MDVVLIVIGIIIVVGVLLGLVWLVDKLEKKEENLFVSTLKKQNERIELLQNAIGHLEESGQEYLAKIQELQQDKEELEQKLEEESKKNKTILSHKKSSEVRIGNTLENFIGLMTELPYDGRNLHHLGQPIDYIYYDYDNMEIIFIEVKTGKAKESKRQKSIKNMIKEGKVYYEKLNINEKGIKVTRAINNE